MCALGKYLRVLIESHGIYAVSVMYLSARIRVCLPKTPMTILNPSKNQKSGNTVSLQME